VLISVSLGVSTLPVNIIIGMEQYFGVPDPNYPLCSVTTYLLLTWRYMEKEELPFNSVCYVAKYKLLLAYFVDIHSKAVCPLSLCSSNTWSLINNTTSQWSSIATSCTWKLNHASITDVYAQRVLRPNILILCAFCNLMA
jgi:hypothetical protein